MGFIEDWKRNTVAAASHEMNGVLWAVAFFARNPLLASLASTLFQAGMIYYVSYRVLEWYGPQGFQVFALALIVIAVRGRK